MESITDIAKTSLFVKYRGHGYVPWCIVVIPPLQDGAPKIAKLVYKWFYNGLW